DWEFTTDEHGSTRMWIKYPLLRSLRRVAIVTGLKAPEDWRTPRRFATTRTQRKSARFWSAPVLWRFHQTRGARTLCAMFTRSYGASGVENQCRNLAAFTMLKLCYAAAQVHAEGVHDDRVFGLYGCPRALRGTHL